MPDHEEEHRYGVVPPSRRLLIALVLAVAGSLVVLGGLLVNWLTDTPQRWPALLVSAGFLVMILAFYLWIRLSD